MVELIETRTAYVSLDKLETGFEPGCSLIEVTKSSPGQQGARVIRNAAAGAVVPEPLPLLPPIRG